MYKKIFSFVLPILILLSTWQISEAYQIKTTQGITEGTFLINPSTGSAYTSIPVSISGGGGSTVVIDQTTPGTTDSVTVKASAGIGSLIETAPATDTASSALNGRLQRIAQRLTSLIGSFPTALTGSGNFKVSVEESQIKGHSTTVSFTRPANTTAYTTGDVVGDVGGSAIFTFPNMAKTGGGEVVVTSVELELDVATSAAGAFNLRLYNASPTAIADNAAWDLPSGDRGKYLGKIGISQPTDEGSTLFSDNDGINKQITLTSSTLYVELQTTIGYTPQASLVKRITIHTLDI